jgi:hypothetical protein
LCIYCNFQQDNWSDLLPMAQYVHNSWVSHTTGFTPFELLIGFTPQICPISTTSSHLPSLEQRKQFLEELRGRAQEAIKHAQQLVLLQCNKTNGQRPFQGFQANDKVLRPSTRRSRCRISVSRAFVEDKGTQRSSLLSCLSRAEPRRQAWL